MKQGAKSSVKRSVLKKKKKTPDGVSRWWVDLSRVPRSAFAMVKNDRARGEEGGEGRGRAAGTAQHRVNHCEQTPPQMRRGSYGCIHTYSACALIAEKPGSSPHAFGLQARSQMASPSFACFVAGSAQQRSTHAADSYFPRMHELSDWCKPPCAGGVAPQDLPRGPLRKKKRQNAEKKEDTNINRLFMERQPIPVPHINLPPQCF